MHRAELDGNGLSAELVDGSGEALGVQADGLAQGTVLVEALGVNKPGTEGDRPVFG
ncbi:hypothetical protein [Streptomyces sp. NPDC101165]|uniref:hypothetical protein n=1 Tax=Streptomyces sp. NPDC101165 TaxID=3366119 RepID=UPI003813F1F6